MRTARFQAGPATGAPPQSRTATHAFIPRFGADEGVLTLDGEIDYCNDENCIRTFNGVPPDRRFIEESHVSTYQLPTIPAKPAAAPQTVYVVASGDLRITSNLKTWPMQQQVEAEFGAALAGLGWQTQRAHDVNPDTGHGFIDG